MNTVELYPKGLWHKLEYQLSGYDTPATFEHEAERPDLKVLSVTTCTEDGTDYELTGDALEAVSADLDSEFWALYARGEL